MSVIAQAILQLTKARYPSSICPSEVARSLAVNEDQWRAMMPSVRDCARELARQGKIAVTQRGRALSSDAPYRGAIRLVFLGPHNPK
jgi:hypothetical protein